MLTRLLKTFVLAWLHDRYNRTSYWQASTTPVQTTEEEDSKTLFFSTNTNRQSILIEAVEKNDVDSIKQLKAEGIALDLPYPFSGTALQIAVMRQHTEAIAALIDAGANVNGMDIFSLTPLHLAAVHGLVQEVSLLIEAGANVNLRTVKGWTPLFAAASEGHASIITLLADAGADLTLTDNVGKTPLSYAIEGNHREATSVLKSLAAQFQAKAISLDDLNKQPRKYKISA